MKSIYDYNLPELSTTIPQQCANFFSSYISYDTWNLPHIYDVILASFALDMSFHKITKDFK